MVCDGLKGLPDSVNAVFPLAIVQTCIIHLIRNTFRYASRKYWDELSRDLQADLHRAVNADAAAAASGRVRGQVGQPYPAIIRLWRNAWDEFIPFLDYDVEIRKVHLLDQRDRVAERPLPPRGPGPRPLPHRAGRDEDACTWSPDPWTPRAPARHDGPCGGSQPSTPSPSPSPTACRPPRNR